MRWLEKEVPSLELCKRLKELSFPQGGEGYQWVYHWRGISYMWDLLLNYKPNKINKYIIKAPTGRELGEWVRTGRLNTPNQIIDGKTLSLCSQIPDELAQEVIWLVENGRVDFKKEER